MTYFLGIDGGGTGCRAVLTDDAGNVLGRGAAGPANIASAPDTARDNIISAATQAANGIPLDQIRAGMGLAGACVAGAVAYLRPHLPFAAVRVETDAVTTTLGALGGRYGIVAAIGTGSVYARKDATGITQIGGRGFAVGDEAGGAWLGREAVSRALRAADGLIAPSPLWQEIIEHFGDVNAAVSWAITAKAADFATIAPMIANTTDTAAQTIVTDGAQFVIASIRALQPDSPLPVIIIGGLAMAYRPHVEQYWPVIAPVGSSVDGALQMARETA